MKDNVNESCVVVSSSTRNCATSESESATRATTTNTTMIKISLKDLANGVLERNSQRNLSTTLPKNQCNFSAINDSEKFPSIKTYSCFKLYELRNAAGDDWDDIKSDKERLEAFAHALRTSVQINMGVVPDHYIKDVHCLGCGDVKLWADCPDVVHGCPWCLLKTDNLQEDNR